MKVLHISTVKFRSNGISAVIMNFFRNMDKSDMQIDLLVPLSDDDERLKEIEEAGGNVYIINRTSNPVEYVRKVKSLIEMNRYDIVHIHGNSCTVAAELIAAKTAGVPVRIVHSHNTFANHTVLHRMLQPYVNKTRTAGFACSKEAGEWMFGKSKNGKPGDNTGNKRNPHGFEVVKNGISVDTFKFRKEARKEIRDKLGLTDEDFLVGHVGNFLPQKNHEFMVKVAAVLCHRNPHFKFLMISDGVLHQQIEEEVKKAGIAENVIFIKKTSQIEKFYCAMDMFILPSLYEGFGIAGLEAQVSGLPCIVSKYVPAEINISSEVKFLPLEETAWIDAINKQFREGNPERSEQSDRNAKAAAEQGYDIQAEAVWMKAEYRKLLEGGQKHGS